MLILLFILWFLTGACSFIYWWTKTFNFTTSDLPLALLSGLMGPISFLIGFKIHGSHNPAIILKKRQKSIEFASHEQAKEAGDCVVKEHKETFRKLSK